MILRIVLLLIFCMSAFAGLDAPAQAQAQDDISEHRSCSICGMDRKAYGYSRMLILYEDGGQTGTCSLHCTVSELDAKKERTVKSILVADRDTRVLVDSSKAVWVIGGKKRGVMTNIPKWAFATEAAARSFTKDHGGSIATWEQALAATREEINPAKR